MTFHVSVGPNEHHLAISTSIHSSTRSSAADALQWHLFIYIMMRWPNHSISLPHIVLVQAAILLICLRPVKQVIAFDLFSSGYAIHCFRGFETLQAVVRTHVCCPFTSAGILIDCLISSS